MQQSSQVIIEKIIVFENSQYSDVGNQADYQIKFSLSSICIFQKYSCEIVNYYGKKQNKNIDRHKCHIEITTGREQQCPSEFMRQYKVGRCYENKENDKINGIEKHRPERLFFGGYTVSVYHLHTSDETI